jgi:hypothetical protein
VTGSKTVRNGIRRVPGCAFAMDKKMATPVPEWPWA